MSTKPRGRVPGTVSRSFFDESEVERVHAGSESIGHAGPTRLRLGPERDHRPRVLVGYPDMSFDADHTPYDAIGGEPRVRALADRFYDHMDEDPAFKVIRDLHPDDLTESREKFYEFLSGWLGGPPLFMQRRGHPRLRMRHAPFPIGDAERDQWMGCMSAALDDLEVVGDLRTFLDARFQQVADFMRNRPPGA